MNFPQFREFGGFFVPPMTSKSGGAHAVKKEQSRFFFSIFPSKQASAPPVSGGARAGHKIGVFNPGCHAPFAAAAARRIRALRICRPQVPSEGARHGTSFSEGRTPLSTL